MLTVSSYSDWDTWVLAEKLFEDWEPARAARLLAGLVDEGRAPLAVHLLLGRTLERQSRHGEAAASFRLAEALEPGTSAG